MEDGYIHIGLISPTFGTVIILLTDKKVLAAGQK
jgi:hypothetical protein